MTYQEILDKFPHGMRIGRHIRVYVRENQHYPSGKTVSFNIGGEDGRFAIATTSGVCLYLPCEGDGDEEDCFRIAEKDMEDLANKISKAYVKIQNGVSWGVVRRDRRSRPYTVNLCYYCVPYDYIKPTEADVRKALESQKNEWSRSNCRTPANSDSDRFGPA